MNRTLGGVVLGLSGAGFPLSQVAIRALGRRGAVLVEGVAAGLLVRDAALIATGAPGRLGRGPAALLWMEAAAAGVAVATGLDLLRDPEVSAARAPGWHVPARELLRRVALGTLFGLHTTRFRIYLSPGSGLRESTTSTGAT
jgi:hypothetical protein